MQYDLTTLFPPIKASEIDILAGIKAGSSAFKALIEADEAMNGNGPAHSEHGPENRNYAHVDGPSHADFAHQELQPPLPTATTGSINRNISNENASYRPPDGNDFF